MAKRKSLKLNLKRGALHKQLSLSKDKRIPVNKLKAAKSKGGKLAKRAQFALNVRKWKHKKK